MSKRFLLFLCFTLSVTELNGAEEPGLSAFWHELRNHLLERGAVTADFRETRQHPIRQHPARLNGELRYDPTHGLSLAYKQGSSAIMVIDEVGLLRKTSHGPSRLQLPDDWERLHQVLLAAMRLDYATLEDSFLIVPEEEGPAWRLHLEPADGDKLGRILGVTLSGTQATVTTIILDMGPRRSIQIDLSNHRFVPTFPADILAQYFR